MKAPTLDACYLGDIGIAARASHSQLEKWIHRRIFVPSNPTIPGRSRLFCRDDAVRVAVMVELVRLGLPLELAGQASERLRITFNGAVASLIAPGTPTLFMVIASEGAEHALTLHTDLSAVHEAIERHTSAVMVNVGAIGRGAIDRLAQYIQGVAAQDEAFRVAGAPAESLYDHKEE